MIASSETSFFSLKHLDKKYCLLSYNLRQFHFEPTVLKEDITIACPLASLPEGGSCKSNTLSSVFWWDPWEHFPGTILLPRASSWLWWFEGLPSARGAGQATGQEDNTKPWLDLPAKPLVICNPLEMKAALFTYLTLGMNPLRLQWVKEESRLWACRGAKL